LDISPAVAGHPAVRKIKMTSLFMVALKYAGLTMLVSGAPPPTIKFKPARDRRVHCTSGVRCRLLPDHLVALHGGDDEIILSERSSFIPRRLIGLRAEIDTDHGVDLISSPNDSKAYRPR
jgi:hypothetical protein